jgi:hypothetical protein
MRQAITATILAISSVGAALPGWTIEPPAIINYSPEPLEIELLTNPETLRGRTDVITADSISRTRLTIPSLWLTKEQLDKKQKLVINWLAYPDRKYIDIIVNPQFWNNLDYTERYNFVSRYGITAQRNGYNVRIFNLKIDEKIPIVAYTCINGAIALQCNVQWQDTINQRGQVIRLDR